MAFSNFFGAAFFGGGYFGEGSAGGGSAGGLHGARDEVPRNIALFGIREKEVIAVVAEQQAQSLEPDAKVRFRQLERALRSQQIAWRSEYLDALNAERERLIAEEISERLRAQLSEAAQMSDVRIMLALIAAAV